MTKSAKNHRNGAPQSNGIKGDFVKKIEPFLEGLYKYYFRCDITGWENVSEEKALFVGNHNGMITYEVLMMFYAWWKKYGTSRKALGLAHNMALQNPFFKWIVPKIGAIPATPERALQALNDGYSLLVYPGGEKEAFRPFTERKKVDFYQRKGFIRLALKAKVPIVPIVSIGAHESYVILSRGEEIAKRLGLYDKYRIHGVPITFRALFLLWCLSTGMLTFFPLLLVPPTVLSLFIPLPAKMSFRILPAIDVNALYDDSKEEEQNLQQIYDYILGQMQDAMTYGYSQRKLPVIG
jgi:1-acyl-sn-glycerol-3-phosphate acyltransferase